MNGDGSLVRPGVSSPAIINEVKRDMNLLYGEFSKADEAHSKGDYNAYLTVLKNEFGLLEQSGHDIRVLEQRLISQLNAIEKTLRDNKIKFKKHEKGKAITEHIDRLLGVLSNTEEGMRGKITKDIIQEGTLRQLTKL